MRIENCHLLRGENMAFALVAGATECNIYITFFYGLNNNKLIISHNEFYKIIIIHKDHN